MQLLRLSRTTNPRQPGEKKLGSELGAEPTKLRREQTDFSGDEKRRETGDFFPYHTLFMSREKFFWKYKLGEKVRYKVRISTSGMRVDLVL